MTGLYFCLILISFLKLNYGLFNSNLRCYDSDDAIEDGPFGCSTTTCFNLKSSEIMSLKIYCLRNNTGEFNDSEVKKSHSPEDEQFVVKNVFNIKNEFPKWLKTDEEKSLREELATDLRRYFRYPSKYSTKTAFKLILWIIKNFVTWLLMKGFDLSSSYIIPT